MSAYFATTLTDLERLAIMAGLLFGVAVLVGTTPIVTGLMKPSARFFRWMSYLTYAVIAGIGTLLLWIPPADAPALSTFDTWDLRGVAVVYGLVLLGIGYICEDVTEEFLTRRGAFEPAPKHFRFTQWFMHRG